MINKEQFNIDKNTPVPLYYQLKTQIKILIDNQEIKEGDLIPTENELSFDLEISRSTVRQALSELVAEGYLVRKKGKGTFIAKPKIDTRFLNKLKTFNEEITERGLAPSSKVLLFNKIEENMAIGSKLNLGENEPLICLKRLRFAGEEPILIQETYLSYNQYSEIMNEDFSKGSLYAVLKEKYHVGICRVIREIEAINSSATEAGLLQIVPNKAITMVKTIGYSSEDKPVEYTISKYRGDRVKFSVELFR